ncbi:MAG: sugar ABC transporter permease [Selenomonas sp.]|uniref:multiple monosaccharide ABC transporter permease n=1 Tax=Selenomonas sp. TaxID=2053611 RepID=UPI0025CFF408|nr:multiple monosaccharide ABC transporter permease [Selenomonas sp.]MCI6084997.1 sugar ABC transporter permease [Selenomonas sp.]
MLLAPMNVSKLIMQNSYILILAIGMLPCILTGDIDLSVGSVLAVVGAISATMIVSYGMSVPLTVAVCLAFGLLVGAWQGFWIAFVRVPSFIVTLAGMLIFRGMTMVILDGNTLSPFPDSYQFIAQKFLVDIPLFAAIPGSTMIVGALVAALGAYMFIHNYRQKVKYGLPAGTKTMLMVRVAIVVAVTLFAAYWFTQFKGLPLILILLAALIAIYSFITNRMVIGRHIYALGGNEAATRLSGIKTKWVRFLVFVNMGLMAAVAGLVFSARLNCAAPSAGVSFELDAIAACYIGGASATGGIGTIVGAVVGGLVMGTLNNGMSILGIGIDWQQMIKGLVLLAAVAFDIYNQSKK